LARIAGVDLPKTKRVVVGLTYIYGIGRPSAEKICKDANVDVNTRVSNLSDEEVKRIRTIIQNDLKVYHIYSVRGYRHHRGLPVHGQRTKTNARTRKGRKRLVGGKKK